MVRPVHAVDQQDVRPAVGVVVEEGAARTHGLGQTLASERSAGVPELNAGGSGDIGQAQPWAPTRRPDRRGRCGAGKEGSARHVILTNPCRMAYTTSSA